jgi:hypothetical protein
VGESNLDICEVCVALSNLRQVKPLGAVAMKLFEAFSLISHLKGKVHGESVACRVSGRLSAAIWRSEASVRQRRSSALYTCGDWDTTTSCWAEALHVGRSGWLRHIQFRCVGLYILAVKRLR